MDAITVHTFAGKRGAGNKCPVVLISGKHWPADADMLACAKQNNCAETAFVLCGDNTPKLRWFTIAQEVDFCGYGTLSAAAVYRQQICPERDKITFDTVKMGLLDVDHEGGIYTLKTSAKWPVQPVRDAAVLAALIKTPISLFQCPRGDLLIVYECQADVENETPDIDKLMACGYYGYILTASGDDADAVYRYFSPRMPGIWEDPVNGASQAVHIPFWCDKLAKNQLYIHAVSPQGGDLYGRFDGKQVDIGGKVIFEGDK